MYPEKPTYFFPNTSQWPLDPGYVIAVDDVSPINTVDDKGRTRDGSDLQPKLIDVFQLRCK